MTKLAAAGAFFDRNFYRGFHGGVPDIERSRMLTVKRSESEGRGWGGNKWTPPAETYEISDGDVNSQTLQSVMENVLLRGLEEELRPEEGVGLPSSEYIGNYKDEQTGFVVYAFLGHFHSNSAYSPRKGLKKRFHPDPREIKEIGWKTLPQIIEMVKKEEFVTKLFLDMNIQEIERRVTSDASQFPFNYPDRLSRLRYDIPRAIL